MPPKIGRPENSLVGLSSKGKSRPFRPQRRMSRVPRIGAPYQARIAERPGERAAGACGTAVFDPARIDERALAEFLARVGRGRHASDGAWEEAALSTLHSCGYDATSALARMRRLGRPGPAVARRALARPSTAAEWRAAHARLNARRDEHDGVVARGATVLLRSATRLPYVARVERVRGSLLDVRWFYRPSDLRGVRAAPNELLLSAHTDTNDVATVVGECSVLASPSSADAEFFCARAVHLPATSRQTVAPLRGAGPRLARATCAPLQIKEH